LETFFDTFSYDFNFTFTGVCKRVMHETFAYLYPFLAVRGRDTYKHTVCCINPSEYLLPGWFQTGFYPGNPGLTPTWGTPHRKNTTGSPWPNGHGVWL